MAGTPKGLRPPPVPVAGTGVALETARGTLDGTLPSGPASAAVLRRLSARPGLPDLVRRRAAGLRLPPWAAACDDEEILALLRREVAGRRIAVRWGATEPAEAEPEPEPYMPAMAPHHIDVFRTAAKVRDCYILVRETNLASLQHVGKPYAVPKRVDCKPKTADGDWAGQFGMKKSAGLVVDPTIVPASAFRPGKHAQALAIWAGWAPSMIHPGVATPEAQQGRFYMPPGKHYFVDLDPKSERYGCLKMTATGLMTSAKYIHGDFDLYGIIPAGEPTSNVRVTEERFGQKHARSPEFLDVQIFVNSRIGVPMVQHGGQESYGEEHSDEPIAMFWPDGRITCVRGKSELEALYRTRFKGRKLFTHDGPVEIVRGRYVKPA